MCDLTKFKSVMYMLPNTTLYIGRINYKVSSTPATDTFYFRLQGNLFQEDNVSNNHEALLFRRGFKYTHVFDGIYARFSLDPGNPYTMALLERMQKVSENVHSGIDRQIRFKNVLEEILINKPSGSALQSVLDSLFITDFGHHLNQYEMDHRISSIITKIRQSRGKVFDVEDLVPLVHLSPSRLMHLFKHETGISLGTYATWVKLKNALDILGEGAKVLSAANEAGFCDQSHFSKQCKKLLGVPPSAMFSRKIDTEVIRLRPETQTQSIFA